MNKGFTLQELCIVIGLSGIIILAVTRMMQADTSFIQQQVTMQAATHKETQVLLDLYKNMVESTDVTCHVHEIILDDITYQFKDGYLYVNEQPLLAMEDFQVDKNEDFLQVQCIIHYKPIQLTVRRCQDENI